MTLPPRFKTLDLLFQAMDRAWDQAAGIYGFQCNGCEDNCCHSLFYHHTHVEKAFLLHGFRELDDQTRREILGQAKDWCAATFDRDQAAEFQKLPCPLLFADKCRLYRFRPMICRLHGIPHELHKPGYPPLKSPGCAAGNFDDTPYHPFDRTPFYREMAGIESEFRLRTGQAGRIRQSVAQILLDHDRSLD